jgi:DMSO/TMAO reductase YedYZ heme-binding membrane subunit
MMILNEDERTKKQDMTWQLTAANWLLMFATVLVIRLVVGIDANSNESFEYSAAFSIAYVVAVLFLAGIITSLIYVLNPRRANIRVRRTLTVCAWIVLVMHGIGKSLLL